MYFTYIVTKLFYNHINWVMAQWRLVETIDQWKGALSSLLKSNNANILACK